MKKILEMNDRFPTSTDIDESLKKIQDLLQSDFICQYRTIFHIYSRKWISIYHIPQVSFSPRLQSLSPSCRDGVQTIVLVRWLNQWMKDIQRVMNNIQENFTP